MILYEGLSQIDGSPIVAIVTDDSRNAKTGNVLQVYILDQRAEPVQAVRQGLDASICGACPLRSGPRTCYVNLAWAPTNIYRKWKAGEYVEAPKPATGRVVRLGAYGDPAAVPLACWRAFLAGARGWLGYTHQWRTAVELKALCMASVDSAAEANEARAAGWRTFRVRTPGEALSTTPREVVCPASDEAGKRLTCERCRLCDGGARSKAPHVAIYAHGPAHGVVEARRVQVPLFSVQP